MIIKKISHRGLPSNLYCENSINAICEKIQNRWDGVEFDIQFTKDKKIIIFHDETYERIYGFDSKVSDVTYSEILSLSSYHVNGPIGTLEALVAALEALVTDMSLHQTIINIELKFYQTSMAEAKELYQDALSTFNTVAKSHLNLHYRIVWTTFYTPLVETCTQCMPIFDTWSSVPPVPSPPVPSPPVPSPPVPPWLSKKNAPIVIYNKEILFQLTELDLISNSFVSVDSFGLYTFDSIKELDDYVEMIKNQCNELCHELWLFTNV